MTDRYYLLGGNVSNSPTPQMMRAAFDHMSVSAEYHATNVAASELDLTFGRLKESGIRGGNVTIPHKTSIARLLDSVDDLSLKIGAVNTISREGGRYHGCNTDVNGIVVPLRSRGLSRLTRATVLGAGGAARAFCGAIQVLGCRELLIIHRDSLRAASTLSSMRKSFPDIAIESASIDSLPDWEPELLFNATPVGANGIPFPDQVEKLLKGKPLVFDAVYFPVETGLIRLAKALGCPVIHGHEMLLQQGLESLRIWFGKTPPADVMTEVLYSALGVVPR